MRGVWCQALSLPRPPVLWSGQPGLRDPCVPGAVGAGVGTQPRPHSVRPCGPALLAVRWREGVPGGVPSAVVRGVCGQALPLLRLPALWSCCWGPSPTCRGRGCVGVGAQHCPLGLHALWGLRAAGVVGGRPRGGWPATVVRGVWCQVLSLPWPPVLWGGQPGFRDPCVPGAVGVGVGTQHQFHDARPLRAGVARRGGGGRSSPGGGAVCRCEGRLGSGAPPPPAARPLDGLLGSATHVLWARVRRRGGPAPAPWPACPVGGCAPRGWRGASGFRRPLFTAARPLGGLPGPLAACRGCGCGCVRCVWCLCGACPGAGCCPLPVPLVPPSLVLCCGVALPVCLSCPLPCTRPLLVYWLPPVSFVASSFFTLFLCPLLARPPPWPASFPCLRPDACLGLSPCLLPWPRFSGPLLSLLLGPVRQREDRGVWGY